MKIAQYTIKVTGYRADAIDRANRSSFYGIFGDCPAAHEGYVAANSAVKDYLSENHIDLDWYLITVAQATEGNHGGNAYIITVTAA